MAEFVERKIGDLTVRIDRATCIGSGNCIKVAPELFQLDSENVVAFQGNVAALEGDRVLEACQVCPVDALIVLDADGNQLIP
jgi:ferredoxin